MGFIQIHKKVADSLSLIAPCVWNSWKFEKSGKFIRWMHGILFLLPFASSFPGLQTDGFHPRIRNGGSYCLGLLFSFVSSCASFNGVCVLPFPQGWLQSAFSAFAVGRKKTVDNSGFRSVSDHFWSHHLPYAHKQILRQFFWLFRKLKNVFLDAGFLLVLLHYAFNRCFRA